MSSYSTDTHTIALSDPDTLSRFCQPLFSSLPRSDQRRWAEVYVRGLVNVPGRKSIRRISEQVVGWRADQCLQQLINQSPWDWQPLRHSLARHLAGELPPRAWVVKEVAFPKNGQSSVGVTRQFASSAGRTLNCQLGLAVFMTGEGGSCPVGWRLLLPRSWDADPGRRARAHLPDSELSAPRWQSLLNLIDEMGAGRGARPVPVVMDLRHEPETVPLLRALDERRLPYVLRVAQQTQLPVASRPCAARGTLTAGEIATLSARGTLTAPGRRSVTAETSRSRLMATDIAAIGAGPRPARGTTQRVVADWAPGQTSPRATWLTSLDGPWLPSVLDSIASLKQASTDLSRMDDESGLRHFEGRSFRGWHHHLTLVSVAHAHRLLDRLRAPGAPGTALASA